MAKGIYVGVGSPIYETQTVTTPLTSSNINSYFSVSKPEASFSWSGNTLTIASNKAAAPADVTLTALVAMNISFDHQVDEKIAKVNVNGVDKTGASLNKKTYSGTLSVGDTITITFGTIFGGGTAIRTVVLSNINTAESQQVQVGIDTTNSVARKVKKMYVGINGVARKVKKAYVGIGGIARPFFGQGKPTFYGTITGLSNTASTYSYNEDAAPLHVGATIVSCSIGAYALIRGSSADTIDVYNESLVRQTIDNSSSNGGHIACASDGTHAIFYCGYVSGSSPTNYYSSFDKSLTRAVGAVGTARFAMDGTTVGNYIIFGNGTSQIDPSSGGSGIRAYTAFDKSLTASTGGGTNYSDDLGWGYVAVSANNKYAIFAGDRFANDSGANRWSFKKYCRIYDTSLTASRKSGILSEGVRGISGTSIGQYAVYAGGVIEDTNETDDAESNTISKQFVTINPSLTVTKSTSNYTARGYGAATTVGEYGVFAGGINSRYKTSYQYYMKRATYAAICDASMTISSIASTSSTENHKFIGCTATTVGDYALFAGGHTYANDKTWGARTNTDTVTAWTV